MSMSLTIEEFSELEDEILSSDGKILFYQGNIYFGFETDMLQ